MNSTKIRSAVLNKRVLTIVGRLLFGCLDLVAINVQLNYSAEHNALNLVNFFSYFTILSNVFATVILIWGAINLIKRHKPTHREDVIRSAAVLYMTVTGIVYAALLAGQNLGLLLPWVNDVLHILMPIVVILDWLYLGPRSKLKLKQCAWLFIFPLVFLAYSLIRGPIVGWYPYTFLNPTKAGGYIGVALYSLAILVLFSLLGWSLVYSGNKLQPKAKKLA
jgi:hypothetical protein